MKYFIVGGISDQMFEERISRKKLSVAELRELVYNRGSMTAVRRGDESILDVLDRRCGLSFCASIVDRREVQVQAGKAVIVVRHQGTFNEKRSPDDMVSIHLYES